MFSMFLLEYYKKILFKLKYLTTVIEDPKEDSSCSEKI